MSVSALPNCYTLAGADVGLIDFNHATFAAKGSETARAHRFANAVRHEPGGFQSHAESAVKLVGADPLLAARDQVHRLQPQMQRNVAALEHSTHANGERLAALVALVEALAGGLAMHLADALHTAAVRAHGAFRPNPRFDVCEGRIFVVEMRG